MDIWLPKDERELLKYYYGKEKERGETLSSLMHELAEVLGFKGNNESALKAEEYPNRVLNTNIDFKERGLINYFSYEHPKIDVKLTRKGRDLGKKYSSKLSTSYLWCEEHKLILTIIGLILTLLIVIFTGISAFKHK